MDKLNRWFELNKDKADFRAVYIAEAHPTDGWQVPQNERDKVLIATHKAMKEREAAAKQLLTDLKIKLPIVVDAMDDKISAAYSAWPDRIFIIGKDMKIAYRGGQGPAGFKVDEARMALDELIKK